MPFLVIGIVLLVVGVILYLAQRHQTRRASSLRAARPATVAELERMAHDIAQEIGGGSWRDYVRLVGDIVCDHPLISELKQEPCVHYSMTVRREYEETITRQDETGKSIQETRRSSETLASNQQWMPFVLRDQTGVIAVNPTGAEIETVKVLDEFRPESAGGLISYGRYSQVPSHLHPGRRTLGYHYSESILPLHRRATIFAMVSDRDGHLTLENPSNTDPNRAFIIALKTEEELTKSAERSATGLRIAMQVCLALGVVLTLVGLLVRR